MQALVQGYFDALARGDTVALARSIGAGYESVEGRNIWSRADMFGMSLMLRGAGWQVRFGLADFATARQGDVAWVRFRRTAAFRPPGAAEESKEYQDTAILVRESSGWTIRQVISAEVRPPCPPGS